MIDVEQIDLEGFMGSMIPILSLTDYAVALYVHIDDVPDLQRKLSIAYAEYMTRNIRPRTGE